MILAYKVAIPGTEEEETESASAVDMTKCSWDSTEVQAYRFHLCSVTF